MERSTTEKNCHRCGRLKPLTAYHADTTREDGRISTCKTCRKELEDARGEAARLKRNRYKQQWKRENPERELTYRLRYEYGLTTEEFHALHEAQKGRCAICCNPPRKGGKLWVDHDHATGAVRGLLCVSCNTALGLVKDNPDTLTAMINYLTRKNGTEFQ